MLQQSDPETAKILLEHAQQAVTIAGNSIKMAQAKVE